MTDPEKKVEPTEEQKEAVRSWCTRELATTYGWHPIARFLAEREAKLQARVAELEEIAHDLRGDLESNVEKHMREVAELEARVAELEGGES